jgi:hypothetical protein
LPGPPVRATSSLPCFSRSRPCSTMCGIAKERGHELHRRAGCPCRGATGTISETAHSAGRQAARKSGSVLI